MRKLLMPAEWGRHYGTWLSYPHNPDTFFEKIESVRDSYVEMIKWVAKGEKVHININSDEDEEDLRQRLKQKGVVENIFIHRVPTNDAWCRDHGAIFVRDLESGKIVATDWKFNAWGGKYPYELDDLVPKHMAEILGVERIKVDMVLEGGSIDTNGRGVFLTTEACLLNKNRNPHLSKEDIERYLRIYLGAEKVIWLKDGIVGDDTDGHVDDITRFVSDDVVVTVIEENKSDENFEPLMENYYILRKSGLNIITLPMPDPVYYKGNRLPASYANFYISNYAVIVPTFRCNKDRIAVETLQNVFKDRKVVGVDAYDIVVGLGTFHCLTQQIPQF